MFKKTLVFTQFILVIFVACTISEMSHAQEVKHSSVDPLIFKVWRDQQVVTAQNQLTRISNYLVLLKSNKIKPEDVMAEFSLTADLESSSNSGNLAASGRLQKNAPSDLLSRLEREQSRISRNLDYAKELTLEEYLLGYLSQFAENQAALGALALKLSKEELAELLRISLKSAPPQPASKGARWKNYGPGLSGSKVGSF